MYKTKRVREWLIDFDFCNKVTIDGKTRTRRSFLIKNKHVGLSLRIGSGITIQCNDIGRVFLVDELWDGSLIDYIISKDLHPEQWFKYGGHKVRPVLNPDE